MSVVEETPFRFTPPTDLVSAYRFEFEADKWIVDVGCMPGMSWTTAAPEAVRRWHEHVGSVGWRSVAVVSTRPLGRTRGDGYRMHAVETSRGDTLRVLVRAWDTTTNQPVEMDTEEGDDDGVELELQP